MKRAVERIMPTLTALVLSSNATANQIATCFALFEMFDLESPQIVQFAAESWRDFRFPTGGDLFLENFLLQTAWKSSHATMLLLLLDTVRERAMASSTYTRVMWPLVFALQCKDDNGLEQRLLELEPTKANVFIAYLAKHAQLLSKVKQSQHIVDIVLVNLLRVAPTHTADKQVEETDKSIHLNFKRVISALRGKNID